MAESLLKAVALLALVAVNGFFPGFAVARRLRLSPLEKLCLSIALSLVFVYLAQLAALLAGVPMAGPVAGSCVSAGLAVWVWRDAARLGRRGPARGALWAMAVMLGWGLLMLAMLRNFGGGGWTVDWVEHLQRTGHFSGTIAADFAYGGYVPLTTRPPLQNAAAAYFMLPIDWRFEFFQTAFMAMALPIVPACLLLGRSLAVGSRARWPLLVALLVTSPMVAQNMTWTWTKLLTAAYVIMAVHFYLAAWRKDDATRMCVAFVCLTAGCLVHYSAGVYAVFIAGHYAAVSLWRRRLAWREWLVTGVVCAALAATWFGYALATFGPGLTFGATSTASGFNGLSTSFTILSITQNILGSLVPFPLLGQRSAWTGSYGWGHVRDYGFRMYQVNLPMMLGVFTGLAATWLAWRVMFTERRLHRPLERWFWPCFIVFTVLVGVAVVPPPVRQGGVAHASLMPLVLMGLTLVAVRFATLPAWVRWAVVLSRVIDFAWGVLLHLTLEGMALGTDPRMPFNGTGVVDPYGFDMQTRYNWLARETGGASFWGDHWPGALNVLRVICGAAGGAALLVMGLEARRSTPAPTPPAPVPAGVPVIGAPMPP